MSAKEQAIRNIDWEKVKQEGETHYKTGTIEPIDLYKSLGILKPFCLASIIKYASRNVNSEAISDRDMNKLIHYAQILKAAYGE